MLLFYRSIHRNPVSLLVLLIFLLNLVYLWNRKPVSTIEDKPLVFIGGHPRSGTTLMRVMLDVHPMIRCGPETHILPRVLMQLQSLDRDFDQKRMAKTGFYPGAVNSAFGAFIRTLIQNAGADAPILCNKDPLTLKYLDHLAEIFPSAKFILMVRDGRAVVNSMIKRRVKMGRRNLTPLEIFERWENMTWIMLRQCDKVGNDNCLVVRYEDLVLRPTETMHIVLSFINAPWDPVVLKHEEYINKGTVLNSMEPSTSQVQYPINTVPLYSWTLPDAPLSKDIKTKIHLRSALLKRLNYAHYPPLYGTPERKVAEKSEQLQRNPYFQKRFFASHR